MENIFTFKIHRRKKTNCIASEYFKNSEAVLTYLNAEVIG
jgi:hypothetical protein